MFVIPNHPVTLGFQDMKRRGIRLRFITEITKDNISSCKEFMKTVELRHLDDVKGNFGVGDSRLYQASAKNIESAPPPLLIESTVKGFVEQQQISLTCCGEKQFLPSKELKRLRKVLKGNS
jgi:two-component system sensor histidine kinase VicK